MSPAPTNKHQRIFGNIHLDIGNYLRKSSCKVYVALIDVRLISSKKNKTDKSITTVVQPDICLICNEEKLDTRGCLGAPDLIIEIVSKGNTKKELETKFDLYEENSVREYWVVFQNDETINVFDLVKGKYKYRKTYSNDSIVPVVFLKGQKLIWLIYFSTKIILS